MKAVLVPTGASTALMIESRRATGYDTGMAREGALVYLIDTAAGSGNGPIKVIGPAAGDAGRRTVAHGRQSDRPCCQRWR
ncbi:hypothetical protein F2P45_04595 [Massilia sp. CCM 8733]|uniref:Uncharacterized protein n=2 Tax=Massilia mucilaginosa TaxID=2609282 RepID=A0ABX0NN84_9BURK|nr:hypothetical protein [Massilia mucilaginosa]